MKHIKHINEYRTVGFRYSEPDLGFTISFYYKGEITEDDISAIAERLGVKVSSINIGKEFGEIEIESPDGDVKELEVDGNISLDFHLYDEKKIDAILDEMSKLMYSIFTTSTYEYNIKEHKENLKK
jgi:hypothetical protein